MDKLKMQTPSMVNENFEKLSALFPNAVTEAIDENGVVVRAIDADVLRQEINVHVVEGREERYQFTWPDKKKAVRLANSPIAMTLRPVNNDVLDKNGSVIQRGSFKFNVTENLYIEGDNLDVLKLLRETYLNKVKMIYIDPPYNTGNDFIYEDDFAEGVGEFLQRDHQYDEDGNRLVKNLDSNGRFHTDWLNMIYPRLRVARDLLKDDGVIFISIDDRESYNLRKVCDEIFGNVNFVAEFVWKSKLGKVGTTSTISTTHEYIVCYGKQADKLQFTMIEHPNEGRRENLRQWGQADRREDRPSMYYPITIDNIDVYPIKEDGTDGRWRVGKEMADELLKSGSLELVRKENRYEIYRNFDAGISVIPYDTLLLDEIGTTAKGALRLKELDLNRVFDYSKPVELLAFFTQLCTKEDDIILDFFSGSATTAHAVMQLNAKDAEDGGKRKFIMVQLPEVCDEKSEAAKAGYKNICEIGKERIRRAGVKIKADTPMTTTELDTGFRVLKLDSSNMEDVYYTPQEMLDEDGKLQINLDGFVDNIKKDRTDEDLLFQVMLDLGIPLSSKIQQREIGGAVVFFVASDMDNYLVACFQPVTDEIVTEIAQSKPHYAVFRDSSFASDATLVNFEQIFKTYSPTTEKRVL